MTEDLNDIIDVMYASLALCNTHPDACLDKDKANTTTVESLALDSLDLLQFAMDVEEKLDVEMDVVEFPGDATLQEVAEHFLKLFEEKKKSD
ncbi:phosphopantetheine-binding protein [Marivita sp.]|uniref:phosphopantetheine-binding protein n=1 Tax=Marivita sp. TaxID=2003365 RepID=UPI003B59642A